MDVYNSGFARLFAHGEVCWAVTIGPVTFYSVPEKYVSAAWRRHEECHKRQWKRLWYIGFLVAYIWYQVRFGYKNNPFEVEARAQENL